METTTSSSSTSSSSHISLSSTLSLPKSCSKHISKTRHSGPSKRVNVVRKFRHFIKSVLEDKNRTFLMHRILRLKASAEHTQFRKLEVSVSLLTQIISLIPKREKSFFRETDVKKNRLIRISQ